MANSTSIEPRVFDPRLVSAFDQRRLDLILLSTEKCNYRCTYCYEDFALGQMPAEVVAGVKNLIAHRVKDLRQLSIEWFGGEPLLAQKTVFDISEYAFGACKEAGIRFNSSMTTNGSKLTESVLQRLVNCGVSGFQITLDGDRDSHNRTRLKANGRGSFDEIWSNLLSARNGGLSFNITLRIHVSPTNYAGLDSFVDKIYENFGGDSRFSIYFHKINDLGGGSKDVMSYAEYAGKVKFLSDKVSELWNYPKDGGARSEQDLSRLGYVCYAAKPNSLLVRSDGRIGKCTVAFDDDRNNLGSINPDGTISIDNQKLGLWMAGFSNMDKQTLACPLSKLGTLVGADAADSAEQIPILLATS